MDSLEIAQKQQTEVGTLRQLVVTDPEIFLPLTVPASAHDIIRVQSLVDGVKLNYAARADYCKVILCKKNHYPLESTDQP